MKVRMNRRQFVKRQVALHLANLTPGEDQLAKRIEKN